MQNLLIYTKQGRIRGNPVVDGWAGAVVQKPLAFQKYFGRTDRRTDTARCRVACPRLKREKREIDKQGKKKIKNMIFFSLLLLSLSIQNATIQAAIQSLKQLYNH